MILLDTCILLRLTNDGAIPQVIRAAMEREPWAVSVLSAWEIGIKHSLGKLVLESPPDRWWPRVVSHYRLQVLAFTDADALNAAALPGLHADPFDRGIIASAIGHDLAVATVDPIYTGYVIPSGLRLAG